jgi:hypothetical protein
MPMLRSSAEVETNAWTGRLCLFSFDFEVEITDYDVDGEVSISNVKLVGDDGCVETIEPLHVCYSELEAILAKEIEDNIEDYFSIDFVDKIEAENNDDDYQYASYHGL